MNCEELIRYLSDYIDNDLEEELRRDAQEHLATCKNCKIMLDSTQQTIILYRKAQRQVIPAMRREILFNQLQQALKKQKSTGNSM
jgi:predicted anti-sigma-YlaC factor YlaD